MTTIAGDTVLERKPRRRPWWGIALAVAVVAILALLAYGVRLRSMAQVDRGPAPDFVLKTFDGQQVRIADLKGKPVVINFWASWCLECYDEAPLLEQASRDHAGEIVFLGVAYVDTEPESLAYLERFG